MILISILQILVHHHKEVLNENSNGLLRKDGLPKQMDFNEVDESFIQSIASKRNNIPRKSLNYKNTNRSILESHMQRGIV